MAMLPGVSQPYASKLLGLTTFRRQIRVCFDNSTFISIHDTSSHFKRFVAFFTTFSNFLFSYQRVLVCHKYLDKKIISQFGTYTFYLYPRPIYFYYLIN